MEFFISTHEAQKIISSLSVTAKPNAADNSARVLIEVTKDQGVVFTSVNPTTSLVIQAEDTLIEKEGCIAVLYSKLKSFISALEPWDGEHGVKELKFKETAKGVFVSYKAVNFNNKVSRGRVKLDTFPSYTIQRPQPFKDATFILGSDVVKAAVNKVLYAINPNEARKNIRGMHLTFTDELITFVGTDGLKLSEYEAKNISNTKSGEYTINHAYMSGLRRLLTSDTQIFFEITGGKILAKIHNMCYTGRLVVGHEYPAYKPVLESYTETVTVNKEILVSTIRPMMGMLDPNDHNRLCVRVADGQMLIKNEHAELVCIDDVDVDKKMSFDMNGVFMMQTIDSINTDSIVIKSADKGVVFDSETHGDQKAFVTLITQRD